LPIKIPADQIATMASRHLAAPVPAPDAAPGAPKLGTKRKEPEPEPDRQDEAYLLAESLSSAAAAAAANRPQSIPPPVGKDVDDEEDRELAEWIRMAATAELDEGDDEDSRELAEWWMAAAADEQLALIHEWQAKLGRITPAPDDLEPYDDLDPERFDYLDSSVLRPEGCEENESKRRLGRDGLVRYLD